MDETQLALDRDYWPRLTLFLSELEGAEAGARELTEDERFLLAHAYAECDRAGEDELAALIRAEVERHSGD